MRREVEYGRVSPSQDPRADWGMANELPPDARRSRGARAPDVVQGGGARALSDDEEAEGSDRAVADEYFHSTAGRGGDNGARSSMPRGQPRDQAGQPKAPRTRIGLLRAMARANVASNETCELLLRGGFVRVNGLVREEPSFVVDTLLDVISVNGRDVEFPRSADDGDDSDTFHRDGAGHEDEGSLTRTQRDFRKGKFGEEGRAPRDKRYSRRVDGGFYSGRRWLGGK
jgi:hypothetical protein